MQKDAIPRLGAREMLDGRSLELIMRRGEDNIKSDLKETGCVGLDWSNSSHERGNWRGVVKTVMNIELP
jgi:hypothetical protein